MREHICPTGSAMSLFPVARIRAKNHLHPQVLTILLHLDL
jgi:hypothetical protein